MKIVVILSFTVLILCVIILCAIIYRFYKISKFNEKQILKVFRQLRYGQLNIDLGSFKYKNIQNAASKLTEALNDREVMLEEYKHILMEKNKSLEKMIEIEKESQQFKDDFVAALTHDLKTPVIAEINTLEMILAGTFGEITPAQREVLEMMLKSDKDLINLIKMLLQTYKYQEGNIRLNCEQTDFISFIKNTVDEMIHVFSSKHQKISVNTDFESIFVNIDKIHFKRVIENLLINANNYGDENSEIEINISSDSETVVFRITNTGQTVSQKDIDLIFKKYYTGTNKFTHLGTGLGLYCAHKIVQLHKGEIKAETDENKTTFIVTLPK